MPEWLVERGIGERRCALVEDGHIVEARIELDGIRRAGSVLAVRLTRAASRNAIARGEDGAEYLLPRGAPGVTEGAALTIEIAREAISGSESWKHPLARVTDEQPRDAPPLAGRELAFPAAIDELGLAGWNDLIDDAVSGLVDQVETASSASTPASSGFHPRPR